MAKNRLTFPLALAFVFFVSGALLAALFAPALNYASTPVIAAQLPTAPASSQSGGVQFNPPKPEDAPKEIRDAVILGANILSDTQKYAAQYVGNGLTCSNCHFDGGRLAGGRGGGLSLVGTAATYPRYRPRQDYAVDLTVRVNDCFQRSENGKPLPEGSHEMEAVLTYLKWLSKGIPVYGEAPWLKLEKIQSNHAADSNAGREVFDVKCAPCHGRDGLGTTAAPPLWGDRSYNDGAGMSKQETLSAFALLNMPFGSPNLSPEQALDVAAFVDTQPRPKFHKQ